MHKLVRGRPDPTPALSRPGCVPRGTLLPRSIAGSPSGSPTAQSRVLRQAIDEAESGAGIAGLNPLASKSVGLSAAIWSANGQSLTRSLGRCSHPTLRLNLHRDGRQGPSCRPQQGCIAGISKLGLAGALRRTPSHGASKYLPATALILGELGLHQNDQGAIPTTLRLVDSASELPGHQHNRRWGAGGHGAAAAELRRPRAARTDVSRGRKGRSDTPTVVSLINQ